MLLSTLCTYYSKFGGLNAIRFYMNRGLLWPMARKVLHDPFNRHSYMNAYYEAVRDAEVLLKDKYSPMMNERKAYYNQQVLEHNKSKIVWFCWLQGIDKAPHEVRICLYSLQKNLTDRIIKVVDARNWSEYIELPDYVVEKWNRKQISSAHFADLLRLQLLIDHGGTWIDATVLCTGVTPQNEADTRSFMDADLFMFQYTRPGSSQWGGIGNWFITSCSNNKVLLVLRDMLFAYWKEFDFIIDYYIFHLFFSLLREAYPDEIASMPYGYAKRSLALVHHWGELFTEEKWERLTSQVCFHMITPFVNKKVRRGKGNYYHYILDTFGQYSIRQ